ncbi:hypothetical protein FJT64_004330 [Amphibalanus amphitrite]|uniref:Peptidase A2B Ty3 transposon peptidase domain-containing protein n=1 Tax=Amphibalanus amphitrite TaxID=1232801 RepID=A0A6A4VQ40_AMPAM|nr:hypothetical protein FJT64_004330 [Amphibalanus amphitrite]
MQKYPKSSRKTAKVEASGLKSTCRVRVMCDSGSNATFIRSDTAHMLGCRIQTRQPLQVSTFGGGKASHQLSEKVEVGLTTQDGSLLRVEAYKIPNICGPPPVIGIEEIQLHEHLRGLKLAEEPGAALASVGEIEILLGQDVLQDVFDGDMRVGQSGPMAISSRFGWIVCGRSGCATPAPQEMMANFVHTETESVKATLDDLWTLEGIGISSDGVSTSPLIVMELPLKQMMPPLKKMMPPLKKMMPPLSASVAPLNVMVPPSKCQ